MSAQKYGETILQAAEALGVSPTAVSHKRGAVTAAKLAAFKERSMADFTPFALCLDTIHRGGSGLRKALRDLIRKKMSTNPTRLPKPCGGQVARACARWSSTQRAQLHACVREGDAPTVAGQGAAQLRRSGQKVKGSGDGSGHRDH